MKALENLGFDDALRYIKKGLIVERDIWQGKKHLEKTEFEDRNDRILVAEHIGNRIWYKNWRPIMIDIMATDWKVRE